LLRSKEAAPNTAAPGLEKKLTSPLLAVMGSITGKEMIQRRITKLISLLTEIRY
jgi:hypothetical protein